MWDSHIKKAVYAIWLPILQYRLDLMATEPLLSSGSTFEG